MSNITSQLTDLTRAELIGRLAKTEILLDFWQCAANADPLTGMANRFAGMAELCQRMDRGERITIFFMDLDGFKAVNDTAGHRAGDKVLSAISAAIRKATAATDGHRTADLAFRYGGDEFVIVSDCAENDAAIISARLKAATAGCDLDSSLPELMHGYRCGASIGCATWNGAEPATALIERADAPMYEEKRRRKALGTKV